MAGAIFFLICLAGIVVIVAVKSRKIVAETKTVITKRDTILDLLKSILTVYAVIIGLSFLFTQCSGNDTDTYSATCTACNETYSYEGHEYGGWNQRNVKCIRMTNLCKECYEIYCWSIGRIPKDY